MESRYENICNSLNIAIDELIEAKSKLCNEELLDENIQLSDVVDDETTAGKVRILFGDKKVTKIHIDIYKKINTDNKLEDLEIEKSDSIILHLSGRPRGLKRRLCPKCNGRGRI